MVYKYSDFSSASQLTLWNSVSLRLIFSYSSLPVYVCIYSYLSGQKEKNSAMRKTYLCSRDEMHISSVTAVQPLRSSEHLTFCIYLFALYYILREMMIEFIGLSIHWLSLDVKQWIPTGSDRLFVFLFLFFKFFLFVKVAVVDDEDIKRQMGNLRLIHLDAITLENWYCCYSSPPLSAFFGQK